MKANAYTGTAALCRLILRRDWLLLVVCVTLPALLAISTAASFNQLLPTVVSREAFVFEAANIPAEVALLGHIYAPTIGGLTAWRWSVYSGVLVGLGSALFVVRHTRTQEEAGRFELLDSTVVGRQAALSASLLVTLGANVVIAILVAGGLIGYGLPVVGSVALGLSVAAVGATFAAVAGVAVQLTESAGTAKGIAAAILGLGYLLRVAGDMGAYSELSWLSPLGWMQQLKPFAAERWWVFVLFIWTFVLLTITAFELSYRRDVGSGLLRPRLGPAAASPRLRSPVALVWRLHRRSLLAWVAGFAVFGVVTGDLAKAGADQLAASPQLMSLLARFGGRSGVSDGFFTFALTIVVEIAAVYAITATLNTQSEEREMRIDPVLAMPVSRLRWAASYVLLAVIGTAVVLAAFSVPAGLTYGVSVGNVGYELPRVLAASMAYLPAIMVMAGIAMALYGLMPKLTFVSWGALLGIIVIELLGEILPISQSIQNVSPFTHVPKVLVSEFSATPLILLAAVALALIVTGLLGFQHRSIG
jgi:ABC-2 type transport system permease protein